MTQPRLYSVPVPIHVLLAVYALLNAYAAFRLYAIYRDLEDHFDPNLPHWPYLLLTGVSVAAVVALIGLWFWKRWGYFAYLGFMALSAGVELATLPIRVVNLWPAVLGLGVFLVIFTPRLREMT